MHSMARGRDLLHPLQNQTGCNHALANAAGLQMLQNVGKMCESTLKGRISAVKYPSEDTPPPPFILDFLNRSEYVNSLQDGNKAEIFF